MPPIEHLEEHAALELMSTLEQHAPCGRGGGIGESNSCSTRNPVIPANELAAYILTQISITIDERYTYAIGTYAGRGTGSRGQYRKGMRATGATA